MASLVTGSLSVFFSCTISPAFHGLHTARDIRNFLTKPTRDQDVLKQIVTEIKANAPREISERDVRTIDLKLSQGKWRVPSASAAMMIIVPMSLLNIALNAFLFGLGIYLGKVFTADLIPSYGTGSLGILIVFAITSLIGIAMFYMAQASKDLEISSQSDLGEQVQTIERIVSQMKAKLATSEGQASGTSNPEPPEMSAGSVLPSVRLPRQPNGLTFDGISIKSALTDLVRLQEEVLYATQRPSDAVNGLSA